MREGFKMILRGPAWPDVWFKGKGFHRVCG